MYIIIFISSIYLGWNLFYEVNENISTDIIKYIGLYTIVISGIYMIYQYYTENHKYRKYLVEKFDKSLKFYEILNFNKINLGASFSKPIFLFILSFFIINQTIHAISIEKIIFLSFFVFVLLYFLVNEKLSDDQIDEIFSKKYTILTNIINNKRISFGKHKKLKFKDIPNDYISWIASPSFKKENWYSNLSLKMRRDFTIAKNYSNLLNNKI